MPDPAARIVQAGSVENAPTLGAAVAAMTRAFADAQLDTPALDARRLVLFALSLEPVALLREPERVLSNEERRRLAAVTARRLQREPVSRIEGRRAFHGLDLEIGAATLDPRPDTETLVEAAIKLAQDYPTPRILDLGTGSGAILLALLHALPKATGTGIDINQDALRIAARNAARHGLADRAVFRQSNWLDAVDGRFDLVVSNPPYIPQRDLPLLEPEVGRFDPSAALDGGSDGLDAYRAIAGSVANVLSSNAWVAVEVGAGQAEAVAHILRDGLASEHAGACRIWHDLAGIARCVAVRTRV